MDRFDNFCNLLMEAYGKRMDIPPDGRPAADRYNNPVGHIHQKNLKNMEWKDMEYFVIRKLAELTR